MDQTHLDGDSYHTRQRRRNVSQAGMLTGSSIFGPPGVSQAATSIGNQYHVAPGNSDILSTLPGVLPL